MDDPKLRRAIATANTDEDRGDHERAEAGYLEAVRLAGHDDLVVGQLYVNLGRNAEASGRDGDAVAFYLKAIKSLEGLRGDGLVQCAYAHWNLAKTLLRTGNPKAVHHGGRAKELFDSYPFASPTDIADADVMYVSALAENGQTVTQALLGETWDAVLSAPLDELDSAWDVFLINYLHIIGRARPTEMDDRIRELRGWAPGQVVDDILRRVKGLRKA